jgi:hypothetical protein
MTGQLRHLTFAVLRWLGVDEAVIGDMQETYRESQSAWWFWREAFCALYASVLGELRVHVLSVVACLAFGLLMVYEVAPAIVRITIVAAVRSYDRSYFENGGLPPPHSGDFIWILNFAILIFTNMAGGFAAVRLYNGRLRLLAIMFAVTVVCQRLLFFLWNSTAYDPSTASLYFMFGPAGSTVITIIALESMAALAGGLAATHRRQAFGQ